MKMLAYAILAGAVWLWVEQPFIFAVAVALGIGAVAGYALRDIQGGSAVAVPEPLVTDPDVDRLVEMGFTEAEVRPQLQKARMKGETDPVGYAMRALIR